MWLEVARQTDQAERARRIAALIAEALPQVAPFERVVRQAAGADDEIAGLARDILGWQQTTTSRLVDVLAGAEGLRPGLNHDEAADLLFALGGPEVYHLRVEVRGWSPDRFESHLVGLLDQMTGKPRRQPRARRDESRR